MHILPHVYKLQQKRIFFFYENQSSIDRQVEAKISVNHAQVAQTAHSTFEQVLVFKLT